MKNIHVFLGIATIIRLLVSFIFISSNTAIDINNNGILTQAFGPGILPAMSAAILDPVHSWDHLEEACFWIYNRPWGITTNDEGYIYNSIYTYGTRITSPPLVVAFLGETLACPKYTCKRILQKLLLLIADGIAAYCVYHVGKRIYEMENWSNEADMEKHTKRSAMNNKNECVTFNGDLVVPGILRPERGWIVGLQTKIFPPEDILVDGTLKYNGLANGDINCQDVRGTNDNNNTSIENQTPPSLGRQPILTLDQLPLIISVLYYCNPISMLANATGSTRGIWDSLMLLSFYYATLPPTIITKEGIPIKIKTAAKAVFSLSLATYADVGYAVFLLPILLWRGLFRNTSTSTPSTIQRGQHGDWKVVLVLYLVFSLCLHYFASLLLGGKSDIYAEVMIQTMLPNVAFYQQDGSGSVPGPSMGLHWYMFVQMFDRFRPYFTVFVSGVPAIFIIPLMTRLHRYPSILAATFQLLWAIFRPTTTTHTLTLGLHLAMLNPRTIVRMRNPSLISFFALPVPILLFMTFHGMWLVTGNGNPNYIYFQCFAYGMFVTIITMDFVSATVKRDKVRRMLERGTIKKLAKKKEGREGRLDEAKKVGELDDLKQTEIEDEHKEESPEIDFHSREENDEIDDTKSEPAPAVVFL